VWGGIFLTIQEMCKERKTSLGITSQEIADQSGVPLSTVNNFFAHASKSPPLYTAAPICAVLGVSLDAYFGIGDHLTATEETLQAEKVGLEKRLSNKRETIDVQNHTINVMEKGLRIRNCVILVMGVAIVLLLCWCVYVDMHALNIGFWRE
jgi:transcriptional regulator with XRE-family HTH domain